VGSDGELEEEVDMERIVTDQDRELAAEFKVKANKAFAGELFRSKGVINSILSRLVANITSYLSP
jgi:hypothetical protein